MFYKNIIFDIDNTLYNYDFCHTNAINEVFYFISSLKKYDIDLIKESYYNIDKQHKLLTSNTASSHNKYIKIKQLLEKYNINKFDEIHKLYWDTFYKNLKLFEGVVDFIIWNKSLGINIGVLTNHETEYQIEKLKKMNLLQYIDYNITSEEIGCEKPSIHSFNYTLMKMGANSHETIMIGDNFENDIIGAKHAKIYPYHYCNKPFKKNNFFTEFNSFTVLLKKFMEIHNEINNLKFISRYCGERFDLVQAGGGNTSVKVDDIMIIKASGFNLSDINEHKGYVFVKNEHLLNDLSNNSIKNITDYNMYGKLRGSIETFMHSVLKKYTIHLHPIQVNKILISKECDNFINKYFSNSLLIDYDTPGIKVCNRILKKYNNEEIIFLKNHGIIITVDNYEDLIPLLENTLIIFEKNNKSNFDKYKFVNQISKQVNKNYDNITYLCEDKIINSYLHDNMELFLEKITFPDALIFCGISILFIEKLKELDNYFEKYMEYPKVIVISNLIYIINISLQKCKNTEDVLKGNLMILDTDMEKIYLTNEEICYLNNWDAENYRKNI